MTKRRECNEPSSCTRPSYSNDECCSTRTEAPSEPSCFDKCMGPKEIARKYADAVVEVHAEFILAGSSGPGSTGSTATNVTDTTPLGPNIRADIILEGNGFFINDHYIVSAAQLVLMPPSLTSVVNRYPFQPQGDLNLGTIKNEMVRASRILVTVQNVNGCCKSYIYEAELIGVDGAGDIAVLKINDRCGWNTCNPCIEKCHPYFRFGSSRCSKNGEAVYMIGDYVSNSINLRSFNAFGAICEGLLSDHRYVEYEGFGLAEGILVSAPAYTFSAGLPIINCEGRVIGMQTTDLAAVVPRIAGTTGTQQQQTLGTGLVTGPSEFFMKRIIQKLIKARKYCGKQKYTELICDTAGAYYRYLKSYGGIAYDIFRGTYYNTTYDFTSGLATSFRPRVRLTENGQFVNTPYNKEILGIRVVGLAGLNPDDSSAQIPNGFFYVPGGETMVSPLPESLPISPVLGRIIPGDVITKMHGVKLGDLDCQIAPSLITWRLCPGSSVNIEYRRGGNVNNDESNDDSTCCYQETDCYTTCLIEYPKLMDYPWYAINRWPLLSQSPYFFTFPAGQLQDPQFPALTNGAFFHPAI